MQNRYAGDIGDFFKLGLLRFMAARSQTLDQPRRIGINWYLAPDEAHNADGKYINYLAATGGAYADLRRRDPVLVEALKRVVAGPRSVRTLEQSGALMPTMMTYATALPVGSGDMRTRWHQRGLAALAVADIVFVDPDNGLPGRAGAIKPHKYALAAELSDYARAGHSVIAYQHADRSAPAATQAVRRLAQLAAITGETPVGAVIVHRGSCRFFLVTAVERDHALLVQLLTEFGAAWAPHAEVILSASK